MKLELNIKNTILSLLLLWSVCGCNDDEPFPDTPYIEIIGLSKDTVAQESLKQDSVLIRFRFEDGGNNLGDADSVNCFLVDTRVDGVESYRIPTLPVYDDKGVEGEVTLTWLSTCCVYPDGNNCSPSTQYPFDEITLEVYIMDREGNISNRISTPPITLICDRNLID